MASATNQNLFPDLHHKMSKKIAQLTKVIYHLNSKNEEHSDDLTSLADAYETEIDGVGPDFCTCTAPHVHLLASPFPCAPCSLAYSANVKRIKLTAATAPMLNFF